MVSLLDVRLCFKQKKNKTTLHDPIGNMVHRLSIQRIASLVIILVDDSLEKR